MAIRHFDHENISSELWLNAEQDLVEAIARRLAVRHGEEIYGYERVTKEFVDDRWRCYELEARDAIALVRQYDRKIAVVEGVIGQPK